MLVKQYTESGEEHGLIDTFTNNCEWNDFKHMAPNIKVKLEKEKKEDARIVEVQYINMRNQHERLEKIYCRYAGDPIQKYKLIPNYVYKLPMGFVNEVNAAKMPVREGLQSVDGRDVRKDGAPLAKDGQAAALHMLVPANF